MKSKMGYFLLAVALLNTGMLVFLNKLEYVLHFHFYIALLVLQLILIVIGIKADVKKAMKNIITYLPAFNMGIIIAMIEKLI